MSTLSVATIKSASSAAPVFQNSSGTEKGQLAKAWINFNGQSTIAIRDSFNVSFLAYHLKNKYLSIEEKILSSHVITKNVLKYRGAIIPKTKMKI